MRKYIKIKHGETKSMFRHVEVELYYTINNEGEYHPEIEIAFSSLDKDYYRHNLETAFELGVSLRHKKDEFWFAVPAEELCEVSEEIQQ